MLAIKSCLPQVKIEIRSIRYEEEINGERRSGWIVRCNIVGYR